jgi:hypothetical protein
MNRAYYPTVIVTLLCFLLLSAVFSYSVNHQRQHIQQQQLAAVEKRVALDLPLLDLSNELLKYASNTAYINNYVNEINLQLDNSDFLLLNIFANQELPIQLSATQFSSQLDTSNGAVYLVFEQQQLSWNWLFGFYYLVIFIISLGIGGWFKAIATAEQQQVKRLTKIQPLQTHCEPKLIINLKTKNVSISEQPQCQVALANKPLSFYLALIEFCSNNEDIVLSHNKDVPDELLTLANKYFDRLVELGHIIRKRPNFNNSLEKTLSEIRAALDEVLNDYPEQKAIFYPPKAFGEGSRSRLHSYALVNIDKGQLEIIGK